MSTLETLDLSDLDRVVGGQSTTTTAEGTVQTPAGSASVRAGHRVEEPNAYLRCLGLVGGQRSLFDTPRSLEGRQTRLCPQSLMNQR
jgi:hypothetical protein